MKRGAGERYDLILAGAGLANGLIAERLSRQPSPPSILMLEGSATPFGEHTWSFHLSDLEQADRDWVLPMAAHTWPRQSVRFPKLTRTLETGYASITSASMLSALTRRSNVELRTRAMVKSVSSDTVVLEGGETIAGRCVIDARGFALDPALTLGYQKFVGLEVETTAPHGITHPVIMDASVDQLDGYRFVYLLPFSPTRILIEDTRYADGEALDTQALARDIAAYAEAQGWSIKSVVREEQGVLPIALGFDAKAFWSRRPRGIPQAGMRAALFHPTTGYSLPEAVRLANVVSRTWQEGSVALAGAIEAHALRRSREQSFFRLLNRMLFRAAEPAKRHLVLQRFYRLPAPLIERFYAGRTHWGDIARILVGKPPVPVSRALTCLTERSVATSPRKASNVP
jgi:lycopene beta-cyclase